jgi:outer membrane protein OmpA-like peptidoglycan-associated protein
MLRGKQRRSWCVLTASAIALAAGGAISARADNCAPLAQAFNTAYERLELDAAVAAAKQIAITPDCPVETRTEARRLTAEAFMTVAARLQDQRVQLRLLEVGAKFAPQWQLMKRIGDLRQRLPSPDGTIDYRAASLAYQAALVDIDALTPSERPPPETIHSIFELAAQTRSLSPTFVDGDMLVHTARAIAIEAVPVPVEFVFKLDQMTARGQEYAADLAKSLDRQGRPRIALVGHTDPIGSDAYNNDLSLRRAEAVKRYLTEHGYSAGAIVVEGRGKREPRPIVEPSLYTQDQIYQMQRRVEVKFR